MSIENIRHIGTNCVEAEHFSTAPDKVLAGAPQQTLWHCFTNTDGTFSAGIWQSTPGTHKVNYSEDEVICILEGKVMMTDTEGNEMRFSEGDMFVISSGFSGTWTTVEDVKKLYVSYEK